MCTGLLLPGANPIAVKILIIITLPSKHHWSDRKKVYARAQLSPPKYPRENRECFVTLCFELFDVLLEDNVG
jgi:hypothetical protein